MTCKLDLLVQAGTSSEFFHDSREVCPIQCICSLPSYRLPEPNVDMTSSVFYEGKLDSPPEVRNRRLELRNLPLGFVRQIIDPDEPLTFTDVKGGEVDGWGYQNTTQVQLTHLIVRALRDSGLDTMDPEKLLVLAPQKG